MSRFKEGREVSEIRRKLLELQDILDVRNQLERIPECKLKNALSEDIEQKLNPSDQSTPDSRPLLSVSSSVNLTSEPRKLVHDEESWSNQVGHPKKPKWFLWLGIGLIILWSACTLKQCHG